MGDERPFLAFDLGAGSGRAFLGYLDNRKLRLEELHRFRNNPVLLGGVLYWDFLFIWENILLSLKKCVRANIPGLSGIGVDSWNCDFGLIDPAGSLISNPISYRNTADEKTLEIIKEGVEETDLYRRTGVGYSSITALYRFVELKRRKSDMLLETAESYLPIPDVVRFFLTGVRSGEKTILWGSQLVGLLNQQWDKDLIEIASIRQEILPDVVNPGTITGALTSEVASLTGISVTPVVAVAEHDTISATLPIYETEGKSIILSTGSWFIIGQLLKKPIVSRKAFEKHFLNETGVDSFLFARNLMGFYLLENLIASWRLESKNCSYETVIARAEEAPPFTLFIDVNDPVFFSSSNMVETLKNYLKRTGQKNIGGIGELSRAVLEGLAFSVREAVLPLREVAGTNPESLVIIGGGVKNRLLCRMVADATGMEVMRGPAEAAVMGNIGMQAMAVGRIGSIDDFLSLLHKDVWFEKIVPENKEVWDRYEEKRGRS